MVPENSRTRWEPDQIGGIHGQTVENLGVPWKLLFQVATKKLPVRGNAEKLPLLDKPELVLQNHSLQWITAVLFRCGSATMKSGNSTGVSRGFSQKTLGYCLKVCVAGWALLVVSPLAQAGSVSFSFEGFITFADPGNAFGVDPSNSVNSASTRVVLSGTYDDDDYDGTGFSTVFFNKKSGNNLQLKVGNITLENKNDTDFELGSYPTVSFYNGLFSGAQFQTAYGVNGSEVNFSLYVGDFEGSDSDGKIINGLFSTSSPSVPEPSSLALLGAGLVGLYGFRKSRRN